MKKSSLSKFTLFINAILLSFSLSTYAFETNNADTTDTTDTTDIMIPVMDNAQVFFNFTDELPAVLNYYTRATEGQISDFYQQHYGSFLSQEKKRNRLTLTYQQKDHSIRVIISQQNSKRQVDVIIELKAE